jgi:NAD(P)-dependent dehydrogenase (short-subunit alcohol dehydrogenase family)
MLECAAEWEVYVVNYSGTTVLVTGAASGIGKALAEALSARGAQVICADVDLAGSEQTAASIGNSALAIECDLTDPDAAARLVTQSYALSSRLDLVCSNAGIGHRSRVIDEMMSGSEALPRLFEINFYAALKIAQAYSQLLEGAGQSGRLMVTASENSLSVPEAVKEGSLAFYGATKHALLVALEWMRIDHKDGLLNLHVLLPGAVYTPLVARSLPDPTIAPPELELISAELCAERALMGLDQDLFYIPTQAHLLDDMQPRMDEIKHALDVLGIEKTY